MEFAWFYPCATIKSVVLLFAMQVTELLYVKQTQLERLAAEKAAQQLAHEHQLAQARDDAERVKRWALVGACACASPTKLCFKHLMQFVSPRSLLLLCIL